MKVILRKDVLKKWKFVIGNVKDGRSLYFCPDENGNGRYVEREVLLEKLKELEER